MDISLISTDDSPYHNLYNRITLVIYILFRERTMMMRCMVMAAVAYPLMMASPAVAAFPEKPITLIVAYGEKGATDISARTIAPFIEKHLGGGAKIEVINKAGAGGELGYGMLVESAPDGYTIGYVNPPAIQTIPIERKARFSIEQIDPLVNIAEDPVAWTVRADSPFKSMKDFIDHAKTHPSTLVIASSGIGSDDHLSILRIQKMAGIKLIHAPFPSGAAAQTAMLAGKAAIVGQNISEALRVPDPTAVRVLGIMSKERWEIAKDVPTFREQGLDIVLNAQRGIAVPKGVPADVRAKLVTAILAAAKDPEFVAKCNEPATYQPLRVLGPDEFGKEVTETYAEFVELWKSDPWVK